MGRAARNRWRKRTSRGDRQRGHSDRRPGHNSRCSADSDPRFGECRLSHRIANRSRVEHDGRERSPGARTGGHGFAGGASWLQP
jgi:hypothetical protein